MSIKTIMVPMTGAKTDRPALDAALSMATAAKAHVQAAFLHQDPRNIALPQVGEGMTAGMIETLVEAAEDQVKTARAAAQSTYHAWRQDGSVDEVSDPTQTEVLPGNRTVT